VLSSNNPKEKRKNSDFANEWVNIVSTLKEGKRTFDLEIVPINIDLVGNIHPILAKGSFTIDIKKDKVDKYLELRTTDLPPATMINKPVEDKIVVASDGIYPYATPLRAFIADVKEDWFYATDEFGNILSRHIIASVVYRMNTSNKCWVKTGFYSQQHQEYGNFGPMKHYKETNGYYDYQIPCWKVNE
jgi:hypothetical protein